MLKYNEHTIVVEAIFWSPDHDGLVASCIYPKFLICLQTIVMGAGDETLCFWNVFSSSKTQVKMIEYLQI